ncbi:MAG: Uma2 family endonuclease [Desulfobacterales bacterium]
MTAQAQRKITPDEYLFMEREAEFKSEYYDGEIFAMAGASRRHNLICGNVFAAIHAQFKNRSCEAYTGDMRVRVSETGLYTYPDVLALCEPPRFDDEEKDTLLNPSLIVEVLSKSTESYDRGEKFAHYRTISSLKEYVLISQDRMQIEHYLRQSNNRWMLSEFSHTEDTVELPSAGCSLKLSEVYDKVDFFENTDKYIRMKQTSGKNFSEKRNS